MSMINGCNDGENWYIERYKYVVGDVFLLKDKIMHPLGIYKPKDSDDPFLFDTCSGNFHILPEKAPLLELKSGKKLLIEFTKEIRKRVLKVLNTEAENNNKLSLRPGVGRYGDLRRKKLEYKDPTNYFKYIRVEKDSIPYDLIFNRFYMENREDEFGNKYFVVNSVLNELQYSKGEDVENYKYYPESPRDGEFNPSGDGKYNYYNPKVSLYDEPVDIAKDFLAYVMADGNPPK